MADQTLVLNDTQYGLNKSERKNDQGHERNKRALETDREDFVSSKKANSGGKKLLDSL